MDMPQKQSTENQRRKNNMEKWAVFYHEGKELLSYTLRGTFDGEMEDTKSLLAYEHGIIEERKHNMNRKKLYMAYGSNLSVEQMAYRCPDAKIVGFASIENYRLMYKGSKTGAYATIEPEEGKHVPVLVWEISKQDEARLDRYEGYPSFYYKKNIEVDIYPANEEEGRDRERHTAMVYIMDERREHGMPSAYYEEILREGYRRFEFDEAILDEALQYTAHHVYRSKAAK